MKNGAGVFLLVCLCIALVSVVAVFGLNVFNVELPGVFEEDAINKGLDLVGGSSILYQAEPEEGKDVENMDQSMETVITMLRSRLDTLGYTEATVAKVGTDRVRVEIPGIDDPEEAVQKLGSTAKLQFVDSDGNVVLDGTDVKKAEAAYGPLSETGMDEYYVELTLNSNAVTKFADATEAMAAKPAGSNYIAIQLDGENMSVPTVKERIESDTCVISGGFDKESVMWLADIISAGQLPLVLNEVQLTSVGPTLGNQALEMSLQAGLIGIILVMIFMLLIYRLPGLLSDISLVAYMAIMAVVLVAFRVNLSLPGIAGIILTIGMAVDSNVVIFERVKEELRSGKSIRAAVKAGFDRAFTAIFDSNITTLIAAVVLWVKGTGTVQGFAKTLFIGVVISLFMTLVITRLLLNAVAAMNVKNTRLFGVKAPKVQN